MLKQHPGLEGIEAEHALAETVNSEHRGLIHLPFGQQQPCRRLLFIDDLIQQTGI
ncbi:hypothetical protein D3C79_939110 [compost metagenome]